MKLTMQACPSCRETFFVDPGKVGQCVVCKMRVFNAGPGGLHAIEHPDVPVGLSLFREECDWNFAYVDRIAAGLHEGKAVLVFDELHQGEFVDQFGVMDCWKLPVTVVLPDERWRAVLFQIQAGTGVTAAEVLIDRRILFGVDGKCPVRECESELVIDRDFATCPSCDHEEIRQ